MNLASLLASLGLDSSGFQQGLQDAQSSLSSFASVASGAFAGMAASNIFSGITSGLSSIASYALGTASDFQGYGETISSILDGINSSGATMGDGISAGSAKAKASLLEAQDALIKYNEKIAEIQQNIQDVMSGQNVIDAQEKFTDQLTSLQQAYADKVQQINDQISQTYDDLAAKKLDIEQKAADTIQNMQDAHDNTMADKKEKQADTLSKTTSAVTRAALQKQYDDENRMAEDSFQRALATKKAETDRSVKEQEEAAQDAADKQVARLQDQLSREATLEQQKEDKLKEQEADELKRLDTQNAQKLAKYQQELADEERAYQLSVAKREASAASGSGRGAGGLMNIQQLQQGKDAFAAFGETEAQVMKQVQSWAPTTPFTIHDILAADQQLNVFGVSAEKLNPVIGNITGATHKAFGTGTQAVISAMAGRYQMLNYEFGISRQHIEEVNGKLHGMSKAMPITSAEQLLEALQKVSQEGRFKSGLQAGLDTLPGQMSNVTDKVQLMLAAFMGLDANMKPIKGGIFDEIYQGVSKFANFLAAHRGEITKGFEEIGKSIASLISFVEPLIEAVVLFVAHHAQLVATVLLGIAIFSALIPVVLAVVGVVLLLLNPIGLVVVAVMLVIWRISMLAATFIVYFAQIKETVTTVFNFIKNFISSAIAFIKDVISSDLLVIEVLWQMALDALTQAVEGWIKVAEDTFNGIMKFLTDLITRIGKFFQDSVSTFMQWGRNLATAFVNGIKDILKDVGSILTGPIEAAFKMFKGKSPPDEGPLKDIDKWGYNIGSSWVQGFTSALSGLQIPNLASLTSGLGGAGGGNWNYNTQNNLRTSNLYMNNNFSISGQASAMNMVQYLAFQSNHFGAV